MFYVYDVHKMAFILLWIALTVLTKLLNASMDSHGGMFGFVIYNFKVLFTNILVLEGLRYVLNLDV